MAAVLSGLFLLLLLSPPANPLQYQTFIPHSHTLPQPQPQPNAIDSPDSFNSNEISDENENTVVLDLHHVDTLSVPYNGTVSAEALFKHRLLRDSARVSAISSMLNYANRTKADFSSSVISGQGSGEYFTRIGIGTPPRYAYMVLDTGSDIVWIQCSPCRKCYNQSDPVFDPKKSKTFGGVPCGAPLCRSLDSPGCNRGKKCLYQVTYGDESFTVGEFSTETLTFRGTKVKNIAFGCGHDNEGLFNGSAGLLGLGWGKLSFPNQAGRQFGSKFSYCLVDRWTSKPSTLMFGNAAVSRVARFTPLLKNPKRGSFYYVGLEGMSVGDVRVPGISSSLFKLDSSGNGGVIIDSGTAVTRLTRPAYVALRNAFLSQASHLKRGPNYSLFDTCFDHSGQTRVTVPTLVMHFKGVNVSLPPSNYLTSVNETSYCLAFAGTEDGLSIIGNIQQQGFRVVYDLAGSRIGFAPKGCA